MATAAAVGLALAMSVLLVRDLTRRAPNFPSLADHPDHALHGTVAYFADNSRCVRIVAAAGQPSKDVLCLPGQDVARALTKGKEIGPQLVWLPDGRLEVTMFRMTTPPGPNVQAGWQKIVDVSTGRVEDVPEAAVPSQPNLSTHPMTSPSGEQLRTTSDRGRVKIELTGPSGSRTLLSVHGPADYTYGLVSAFWAPNWQWVAADDGRILIVTTGHPAVTRVLTDASSQVAFGGDDPRLARFAVTPADLLPPAN